MAIALEGVGSFFDDIAYIRFLVVSFVLPMNQNDLCCLCAGNDATVRFENGLAACVNCVARNVEADEDVESLAVELEELQCF